MSTDRSAPATSNAAGSHEQVLNGASLQKSSRPVESELTKWIAKSRPYTSYDMGSIVITRRNVAIVSLGNLSESNITWSESRLKTLESMVADLEEGISRGKIRGVVFASPGKDCFVFGADLKELSEKGSLEECREAIELGHKVFARVRALPVKTVAAVSGACVGGGLEFALHCKEIVACKTKGSDSAAFDSEKTKFALPEVMLGIFPGWGGTILAPQKIGLQAIDMILTGKDMYPDEARRVGLVDRIARKGSLIALAERAARSNRTPWRTQGIKWSEKGFTHDIKSYLTNDLMARYGYRIGWVNRAVKGLTGKGIVSQAEAAAVKGIQSFDPTGSLENTKAALKVILYGLRNGVEAGLRYEREQVVPLLASARTKGAVRFHFSQTAVNGAAKGLASSFREHETAIIGAGVMGGGIAASIASKGGVVALSDNREEALAAASERVFGLLNKSAKRGALTAHEVGICKRGFATTHQRTDYSNARIVIEAVLEVSGLKMRVLAEIEKSLRPDAILATNTSSKPIRDLASVLEQPGRFCGIHFFNPAETMKLVEVVRGPATSPQTIEQAKAFVRAIGKTPVVVEDGAGFLVNRVLCRYLAESQHLLADGYYPADIDLAGKHAGFVMGPIDTIDLVGLDIGAEVLETITVAYGERMECPTFAKKLLEAGHKGRKSGQGFHSYPKGAKAGVPIVDPKILASEFTGDLGKLRGEPNLAYIGQRLALPLIDEVVRCLDQGVAGTPGKFAAQQIDVAMVLGSGSLAMHGGPLSYAEQLGAQQVVDGLNRLFEQTGGARFRPSETLLERARRKLSFYEAL